MIVFGKSQNFKICSIIKTDNDSEENLVADKDTKVVILTAKGPSENTDIDELTSLFNRFRITNNKEIQEEKIKFVGFDEQYEILMEMIELKIRSSNDDISQQD